MEKEESSTDGLGVSGHSQMKQNEPGFKLTSCTKH